MPSGAPLPGVRVPPLQPASDALLRPRRLQAVRRRRALQRVEEELINAVEEVADRHQEVLEVQGGGPHQGPDRQPQHEDAGRCLEERESEVGAVPNPRNLPSFRQKLANPLSTY